MESCNEGDCPNPLFEKWLTEMKEQAAANHSPIELSFEKALSSLRKCPIRLETGQDCLILLNFGRKICDILDKKLEEYKKAKNLPSTSRPSAIHKILGNEDECNEVKRAKKSDDKPAEQAGPSNGKPAFKKRRNRLFFPPPGSGSHSILTTMYKSAQEPMYPGYMLRKDVISKSRKYCDSPMKSKATEHFSGWSAMATVIDKHYVIRYGHPSRYILTESGVALAKELINDKARNSASSNKKPPTSISKNPKSNSSVSSESDSAEASTSGTGVLDNHLDSDDNADVFKKKHMPNLEKKVQETQSKAPSSDEELEVVSVISMTDTNSKKDHNSKNKSNTVDTLEKIPKALELSLNESKLKNNVTFEDPTAEYFPIFKKALEIVSNEISRKNDLDIQVPDYLSENEKRSQVDAGPSSKNVEDDDIICIDDDDDDEMEDRSDKRIFEDENEDDNESYMEFCRENAEPVLHLKRKSNHFIFTDGPESDLNKENHENFVQEDKHEDAHLHSTIKKCKSEKNNKMEKLSTQEIEMYNSDFQAILDNVQISPKNKSPLKLNNSDEIVIIDDEDVSAEIEKPKESSSHRQIRDDLSNLPSASEPAKVNPPKSSKNVKEKENIKTNAKPKETPEDEPYDSFTLVPNSFDIVLIVDTQETSGAKNTNPADDPTMSTLSNEGVLYEVRSLKVGDFAWIAKCRFTQKELIFPYIVERKRIDDLCASIIDGRYHEQKHRLRLSGISQVVYLIEHYGGTYHGSIPMKSLFQAVINTTVQDGFLTKLTEDHKNSMLYLAAVTKKLIKKYKSKTLVSCPKELIDPFSKVSKGPKRLMEFNEFNKAALKTKRLTVRETLIKQLVQLKGLSVEKAVGIAEIYPSPQILAEAFKEGGKNLLAVIEVGSSKKKIGPALSNALHMFYTRVNLK